MPNGEIAHGPDSVFSTTESWETRMKHHSIGTMRGGETQAYCSLNMATIFIFSKHRELKKSDLCRRLWYTFFQVLCFREPGKE
jgi:hypothetical protein